MNRDNVAVGCIPLLTRVTVTSGADAAGDDMRLLPNNPDFFAKLWAVAARYFVT